MASGRGLGHDPCAHERPLDHGHIRNCDPLLGPAAVVDRVVRLHRGNDALRSKTRDLGGAQVLRMLDAEAAVSRAVALGDPLEKVEDLRVGVRPATHVSLPEMPSRWPRCVHALLLNRLGEAGGALVVFDVLFRNARRCRAPAAICTPAG
jgi:hypothetical protein